MNWPVLANPWMLTALAAVGLPVLIHFLTRARPMRIAFPPYRFLVEACAGRQSLHRLRTFLLLLIRCLAVAALVILFARPFLKPQGAAISPDAAQRVVIIVDASLSMRAVRDGVTLFARAQADAAGILRSLEPDSEAAVILAGTSPKAVLPALSRNLPALHEGLGLARAGFEMGNPAAALTMAARLLGNRGTLFVLSDFQKSNWETVRELPAGLVCKLRPVASQPVDNVAVTSARVVPAEPVVGENAEVVCSIFNASPQPRQETARLEMGDLVQEARVQVPAYGSAGVVFNAVFSRPGIANGRVSLRPDDLPEDNERHLSVRVQETLRILLVSDAPTNDHRAPAFFVSTALAPSPQATPGFNLARRHGQGTDRGALETADVFVLAPPLALTGEAVDVITRRVQDGAGLVVFLDGPTSPLLVPPGLAPPIRLTRTVSSDPGESVSAGSIRLFAENDAGDWAGIKFRRHFENQVLDGRNGEVVLSYADGSAALTVSTTGRGALALVNMPITPGGGDLAGHPLFPSMLHELLRTLRRGTGGGDVNPGVVWTLDAQTSGSDPLTVTGPDGKPVDARAVSSGRITRLALPVAAMPGVYTAHQGTRVAGTGVVNLDSRESDTRPIAPGQLKAGAGGMTTVLSGDADLELESRTRPLWPQLAVALVIFLAMEMILSGLWRRRPVAQIQREAAR
jgi:hypothetical protein